MFRRKPELLIPIRDRRQRKRYVTLKNFAIASAVGAVAFVAISIRSEMRGRVDGPDFGRLFEREIATDVQQKPIEVVHEAPPPVTDATHADPMLIEPAVRAQWLEADATTTTPPVPAAPVTVSAASMRATGTEVAIVGGPDGVAVVRTERRKPVLSGGFGRN
jgi:hypothetical protein